MQKVSNVRGLFGSRACLSVEPRHFGRTVDCPNRLVYVSCQVIVLSMCREGHAAWTWTLQLFPDLVSALYALVLKANKKELDDWKCSSEEYHQGMESVDRERFGATSVLRGGAKNSKGE